MNDEKRKRLIQLMGMTGSKHDGEALNAIRLANRVLGELGITWEETLNGTGKYTDKDMQEVARQSYEQGVEDGRKAGIAAPRRTGASWIAFARDIRDNYFGELNDWEEGFVESYIERGFATPTPKQRGVFERIADKLDLECPD